MLKWFTLKILLIFLIDNHSKLAHLSGHTCASGFLFFIYFACINVDLITNAIQHIQSACNGTSLTFELLLFSAFFCQIDSIGAIWQNSGTCQNVWKSQ